MIAIAIDGPAGAGKSTIAKKISAELGYVYVDTGALYRAIGLYAIRSGVPEQTEQYVVPLLPEIRVELKFIDHMQRVFLNAEDVSEAIRQNEVSMAASNVSAIPAVREFLFALQQQIARENNVIMDGRDIGTVVLPHADIKIFLTASPEDRAKRRHLELLQKGQEVDFDTLLQEIIERDHNDSTRAIAPLKKADDAITVDTSGNSLEESIALLTDLIKSQLQKKQK
ncbi:MAG: (d)CMP kinase [Clostridiales bacterium]|nr:(d)CMP kinase [Clostridiales bacterium]